MDQTIALFEEALAQELSRRIPDFKPIPLAQRTTLYAEEQYPPELKWVIEQIKCSPGFYRSLEPAPGALEALLHLEQTHTVVICTGNHLASPYCVAEKKEWTRIYLGKNWEDGIIFTRDKTLVRGHYLIDDAPEIKGVEKPEWEHILYDQPYNRRVVGKRRITWNNWRDVLPELT
jgi:5'-nucleotidase